ncbi:family 43 glycosylhydrolase [Paenibacillus abyssi]
MQKPQTPVIGGNFADPSIIRVGRDYYMTHSSYKLTPGLLIWHSRDLQQWKPVSAALTAYIGDVWAPDFAEHNGQFYIYFPAGGTNWVVSAPSPLGPWSQPVDLGIKGIDPGHITSPDGKRYLHMSGGLFTELADDGLSVIGEPRHVYDGWRYPEDWVVEAYSLEGPKLTFHNGYYYLTVAVGGTAGPPTSHMAVSSRSRTPWGPWEHSPYNPIVHTESADEQWWSKGHGSLIETAEGEWLIVYHAYLNGYHTLGRQTLMEPIEWTEDGWFCISEREVQLPSQPESFNDSFEDSLLALYWQCEGHEPSVRFRPEAGKLTADVASEQGTASPLLFMPWHERYEAEVEIDTADAAEGRLMLYYNDSAFFGMGVSAAGVRHFRSFKRYGTVPSTSGKAFIRIRNDKHTVSFYYSFGGHLWQKYDKVIEASGFHHNTFGGFLSLRIALDAVGEGQVAFRNFKYKSLED